MSIEMKWNDEDPETGQKRFIAAEKFAGRWSFRWKPQRRGEWAGAYEPTRSDWEYLLECLERRYRRREGVDDDDLEQVRRILAGLPVPRDLGAE